MFVDFMLIYPILRWTKRRSTGIPFGRGDIETIILQLVTSAVWIYLNQLVMGDNSEGKSAELLWGANITLCICQFAAMGF